jgi:hypothetical protein
MKESRMIGGICYWFILRIRKAWQFALGELIGIRVAMTDLHVLIGTASDDVDMLKKASRLGQPIDWIVPKGARPGDEAVFFVWKHGFVGFGKLISEPVKLKTGPWRGRFRAKVDGVTWLSPRVPEDNTVRDFAVGGQGRKMESLSEERCCGTVG